MLALVVSTRGDEAELAADALWSLGVVAIEERGEADQVELWTSLGDDAAAVTGAVAQRLAAWNWRFVEVDEAVADTWREHAEPSYILERIALFAHGRHIRHLRSANGAADRNSAECAALQK